MKIDRDRWQCPFCDKVLVRYSEPLDLSRIIGHLDKHCYISARLATEINKDEMCWVESDVEEVVRIVHEHLHGEAVH
jgi:hypothetical protein